MKGSCFCGAVRLEWDDQQEPLFPIALCHCRNCHKVTGSFSTNLVFPTSAITIHGTPKVFQNLKTGSGNPAERFFCGDCGTTLFTRGQAFPNFTVLKANVLDVPEDEVAKSVFWKKWQPKMETFCRTRAEWLPTLEGTSAWEAMPVGEHAKPWVKQNTPTSEDTKDGDGVDSNA